MINIDMNKVVGVLCAAGLFFLFAKWGAAGIYDGSDSHHGNDEHHEQAYALSDGGGDSHGGAEEEVIPPAVYLASADAANGEGVFKKCKACHSLEAGQNGTGPTLADIYNKPAGTEAGYSYSADMAASGLTWDADTLFAFISGPKDVVAKTKMSFAGIRNPQDTADLVAYLAGSEFDASIFEAAAAETNTEGTTAE